MSKLLASSLLGLGFALGVTAASAQEANVILDDIEGRVSVNQGKEFVPAVEGMRLKPGDRVMIQEDSEVTLVFNDECRTEVEENKIVTIPDRSTCAGAVLAQQGLQPSSGAAIGSGSGSTGTGNGGVWAMVAIVAAIDICWINGCFDDDEDEDDDTVSP